METPNETTEQAPDVLVRYDWCESEDCSCDLQDYRAVHRMEGRPREAFTVPAAIWERYDAARTALYEAQWDVYELRRADEKRREAERVEQQRTAKLNELRALGYTIAEPEVPA